MMGAVVTAVARSAATLLPLTLLALGLVFVAGVAVIWPTPARRAMVDRLAEAMKNLGTVIAGQAMHRSPGHQPPPA
jgi:hypothetical protein